jgi:hypothetical protein
VSKPPEPSQFDKTSILQGHYVSLYSSSVSTFWNITPYSLVEIRGNTLLPSSELKTNPRKQRVKKVGEQRRLYENGGSTSLRNIGKLLPGYTELHYCCEEVICRY